MPLPLEHLHMNTNYNSAVNSNTIIEMTLTFDRPLTSKTFSAMPTHMINICDKFRSDPFTK